MNLVRASSKKKLTFLFNIYKRLFSIKRVLASSLFIFQA